MATVLPTVSAPDATESPVSSVIVETADSPRKENSLNDASGIVIDDSSIVMHRPIC